MLHNSDNIKYNVCEHCNKSFSRNSSLKRHIENNCKEALTKVKNNIDNTNEILELKKMVNVLLEKNNKLNETCNNNNNNNNNNSNNNNVTNKIKKQFNNQLNNTNIKIDKIEFGKEDLDKLSDAFYINTLMNYSGAIIPSKIIEGIHFNLSLEENMNVYISDMSRNETMVYNGDKWIVMKANGVVENLFDRSVIFCENKHEKLKEKIDKNDKYKKKSTKKCI